MWRVYFCAAVVSLPLAGRESSWWSLCISSSWRFLPPQTRSAASWERWPLGCSRGLPRNPRASDCRSWRKLLNRTELEELRPEGHGKKSVNLSQGNWDWILRCRSRGAANGVLPLGPHGGCCQVLARWRKTTCGFPVWREEHKGGV